MSARALLWRAAVMIGQSQGTGGAIWAGVRPSGGTIATLPVFEVLPIQTLYFVENNPVRAAQALPETVYRAPFWGVAPQDADIQVGDVYSNGAIAFLIVGMADTSQGFQRIPATLTALPVNHARRLLTQGLRTGLRMGAW